LAGECHDFLQMLSLKLNRKKYLFAKSGNAVSAILRAADSPFSVDLARGNLGISPSTNPGA